MVRYDSDDDNDDDDITKLNNKLIKLCEKYGFDELKNNATVVKNEIMREDYYLYIHIIFKICDNEFSYKYENIGETCTCQCFINNKEIYQKRSNEIINNFVSINLQINDTILFEDFEDFLYDLVEGEFVSFY